MATQLDITQASYARMENQQSNLTVERLEKIAEILETDAANFFSASKLTIKIRKTMKGLMAMAMSKTCILKIKNR